MAVKIRLSRTGRKNKPSFRIVIANSRSKRDGRVIETIGHFNPSENPQSFNINKERYEYWKSTGAQTTKAVEQLVAGKYEFKPYEPKREGDKETEEDKSNEHTKEPPKEEND